MNTEKIIYRPWKWVNPFVWVMSIIGSGLCALAFRYSYTVGSYEALLLTPVALICFLMAKLAYDLSRQLFVISDDGVHAFDIARNQDFCMAWGSVKYAYYRKNSKAGLSGIALRSALAFCLGPSVNLTACAP